MKPFLPGQCSVLICFMTFSFTLSRSPLSLSFSFNFYLSAFEDFPSFCVSITFLYQYCALNRSSYNSSLCPSLQLYIQVFSLANSAEDFIPCINTLSMDNNLTSCGVSRSSWLGREHQLTLLNNSNYQT